MEKETKQEQNLIEDPKEMALVLDQFRLGVNDTKDALTGAVARVTNMCGQLISTFAKQKERIEELEKEIKELTEAKEEKVSE